MYANLSHLSHLRKSEQVWTGKAFTFWFSSKTQIYTHLRKSERVWVSRFAFEENEILNTLTKIWTARFAIWKKWKCEHLWEIWTVRFYWGLTTPGSVISRFIRLRHKKRPSISSSALACWSLGFNLHCLYEEPQTLWNQIAYLTRVHTIIFI